MILKRLGGLRRRRPRHQIVARVNGPQPFRRHRRPHIDRLCLRQHDLPPRPVHVLRDQPGHVLFHTLAHIELLNLIDPHHGKLRLPNELRFAHDPPCHVPLGNLRILHRLAAKSRDHHTNLVRQLRRHVHP